MVVESYFVTTDGVPGTETLQSFGLISSLAVRALGFIGRMNTDTRAVVGGDAGSIIGLLASAQADVFAQLRRDAAALGANAVVGVRVQPQIESSHAGQQFVHVTAYGTAVRIGPAN